MLRYTIRPLVLLRTHTSLPQIRLLDRRVLGDTAPPIEWEEDAKAMDWPPSKGRPSEEAVRSEYSPRGVGKHHERAKVVAEFGRWPGDTGRTEVQIALITSRVRSLTQHLNEHKKDRHSRRGLISLLQNRRSLLLYLRRKSFPRYVECLKALDLKDVG